MTTATGTGPAPQAPRRRGVGLGVAVGGLAALLWAAAWDRVRPFTPPGSTWSDALALLAALLAAASLAALVRRRGADGWKAAFGALLGAALVVGATTAAQGLRDLDPTQPLAADWRQADLFAQAWALQHPGEPHPAADARLIRWDRPAEAEVRWTAGTTTTRQVAVTVKVDPTGLVLAEAPAGPPEEALRALLREAAASLGADPARLEALVLANASAPYDATLATPERDGSHAVRGYRAQAALDPAAYAALAARCAHGGEGKPSPADGCLAVVPEVRVTVERDGLRLQASSWDRVRFDGDLHVHGDRDYVQRLRTVMATWGLHVPPDVAIDAHHGPV